jgi:hypothetical protein
MSPTLALKRKFSFSYFCEIFTNIFKKLLFFGKTTVIVKNFFTIFGEKCEKTKIFVVRENENIGFRFNLTKTQHRVMCKDCLTGERTWEQHRLSNNQVDIGFHSTHKFYNSWGRKGAKAIELFKDTINYPSPYLTKSKYTCSCLLCTK